MLSIDNELLEAVGAIAAAAPPTPPAVGDWRTRRATIDAVYGGLAATVKPDNRAEVVDVTVPSADGHTIALRLYKPANPVRPGAVHGFDQFAPESRVARGAMADRVAFLKNL
ncbi:hypothetical protein KBX71_15310 [Micromonospora sp. D93]|uniref:hypothetical protein n=1 Tax=Micromonospora sp. D93 TaxID=2824886 RepID=UPI001B36E2F3|nr:hypothetical protein [Micromonospora sp. D93]MBQ1019224.1 hypothetical protein [Micromonospora sp. D93]